MQPTLMFSKTSTRDACDYRCAFEVTLLHSGGPPSSRQAARLNPLMVVSRGFLFPGAIRSIGLLAPRHRHSETPKGPSDDLACSRESTLVKNASFPQTKMPSIDSRPKTGPPVARGLPSGHAAYHEEHAPHFGGRWSADCPSPRVACRLLQHDKTREHTRELPALRPPRRTNDRAQKTLPAVVITRGAVSDDCPRITTPTLLVTVWQRCKAGKAQQPHHPV